MKSLGYHEQPDLIILARQLIGDIYKSQGLLEQACQQYLEVIHDETTPDTIVHQVSFQLG